jgi:CubicO group peptidase (beta-lactamase class C family)
VLPDYDLSPMRLSNLVIVLIGLFAVVLAVHPQLPPKVDDAAASARVDAYLRGELSRQRIPGLAIGVYRDGKIVKTQGYGFSNLKLKTLVTEETLFQTGSVGKQFTATAIMMLVEAGKISLDGSITEFFPDSPEQWKPIKVRHLLAHTSGLQDYLSRVNVHKDYTPAQLVKVMQSLALQFAPGEGWEYSNTNYALLGFIIESVTGSFHGDFLRERIFLPLGITSGYVASKADGIAKRAEGYHSGKKKFEEQDWVTPIFNSTADGVLYFNVVDLAKWDAALYTEKLLKTSSFDQMWTVARLNNGNPNGGSYGFGWGVTEIKGHRLIEHAGGWLGFKAHIARYIDDKLTVVVLANSDSTRPAQIAHAVAGFYEPEVAFNPIPDTEPNVTALVRAVVDKLADGKTPEGMDKNQMKPFQTNLRSLGRVNSIELVDREMKDGRNYTYRLTFTDAVMYFQIDLDSEGKIAGLHMRE